MDIFEPIREILMAMTKEESKPEDVKLEYKCGIRSSYYPPNELYPDGYRIEYPFAMNPKDAINYDNINL